MDRHKYHIRPGAQGYRIFVLLVISLAGFLLFQNTTSLVQAKPQTDIAIHVSSAQAALTYGVKWGSHNTPASLGAGLQIPISITLTNTGTLTWLKDGDNPVHLTYHWLDSAWQVVVWDGLRTELPKDVPTGQSVTLSASLKAPLTVGNYNLRWDLVQENITWFSYEGTQPLGISVSVITPPKYGALWANYTTPTELFAGKKQSLEITVTNTGSFTWPKGGDTPVFLSYHWYKDGKIVVVDGLRGRLSSDIATGQSITYWPTIQVPSETGEYILKWDMVHENVTWFSQQGAPTADVAVSVIAPFYGADWISHNMPTSVAGGQQATITFSLKNIGYFTWLKGGNNPVYLSYRIYDSKNIWGNPIEISDNTFLSQDVPFGQTATLQTPFQAPVIPGTYIVRWSLRHVGWEAIGTLEITVTVVSSTWGVKWGNHGTPVSLPAFQQVQVPVTITNTGLTTWPAATSLSIYNSETIALSYRWYKDGQLWPSAALKKYMPQTVAPGETVTLQASLEAPSAPGDYVLKWDMVQGKDTWFSSNGAPTLDVPVTVSPITYGVQWGTYNTTSFLNSGGNIQMSVTLTNTGSFTWLKGGAHNVYLSYRWFKDGSEYIDSPQITNLPQDVAPGQTVTIVAALRYPTLPGNFTLKWDLMHYNVGWFSAKGAPSLDIAFAPPKYGIAWMKPEVIPKLPTVQLMPEVMVKDQQVKVTHVIANTGSWTWPNQGDNQVYLSYHWLKDGKVVVWDGLKTKVSLSPGNYGWMVADLKAPSDVGTYTLKWDMVHEGVTWFSLEGSETMDFTVSVVAPPPYAVKWGSYALTSSKLWAGQKGYKSVTVTNTGSLTWLKGGDNPVYLSYRWYKDGQVAVSDGWWTPLPQDVAPGQTVSSFSWGSSIGSGAGFKAPPAAGNYTLKWDMLQANKTWFSQQGASTLDDPDIMVQTPFYGVDPDISNTLTNLEAGKQATLSVKLTNVGSFTWPKGGSNPVYLSYKMETQYGPYNEFSMSKAASLPQDVATGQSVTLQVPMKAPTIPGKYNIRWYLTHEAVTPFGEFVTQATVPSPVYGVQWGSHGTPANLQVFQNVQVPITLTNTSSITWPKWAVYLTYSWYKDGKQVWWYGSNSLNTSLPQDISIGQTVTLQASLEAPLYPGNYTLKWDMVQSATWFSQKGAPTLDVAVTVTDITFGVQWGSHNTPTKLAPAQTADVSITITNTGNFTWPKGGNKRVYLSYHWFKDGQETFSYGYGQPQNTYLMQDVAPGQSVTLQSKISGPLVPGNYTLKWDLLYEGVGWFSDKGASSLDVSITPPTYWAKISTSQGPFPTSLGTNQQINVNIGVNNYGSLTWLKGGANSIYISYHWFKDGQVVVWDGLRTPLWSDLSPSPGGILISANLLVPSTPGNYTLVWDMVQEGVTWFSAQGVPTFNVNVSVTTSTYSTQWVSHNTPTTIKPGQIVGVPITLTNTGSQTWLKSGASPVFVTYHWYNSSWQAVEWGTGLWSAPPQDVATGQSVNLTASLKAPSTAGSYNLIWDMVQQGVAWFSAQGSPLLVVNGISVAAGQAKDVQWISHSTPTTLLAGQEVNVPITLTNTGSFTWPSSGANQVYVTYHWYNSSWQIVEWGTGIRNPFNQDVASGQMISIAPALKAPSTPGNYNLLWDVVQEGVTWFSGAGASLLPVSGIAVN